MRNREVVVKEQNDLGDDHPWTASEFSSFLSDDQIPDDALVTPIMRDIGTQRDPHLICVGLRASW